VTNIKQKSTARFDKHSQGKKRKKLRYDLIVISAANIKQKCTGTVRFDNDSRGKERQIKRKIEPDLTMNPAAN